jgi:hypothetical protein
MIQNKLKKRMRIGLIKVEILFRINYKNYNWIIKLKNKKKNSLKKSKLYFLKVSIRNFQEEKRTLEEKLLMVKKNLGK